MDKSGKNNPNKGRDDKKSPTKKDDDTSKKQKPERKLAPEPKDGDGSAGLSGTSAI